MSGFAWMLGRRHVRALTIVAIALAAVLPAGRAQAAPSQADCDARPNNTIPKMLECVRVGQVRAHQAALQAIANANGGNRFAGLAGHNASVDYVVDTLEAAGWDVEPAGVRLPRVSRCSAPRPSSRRRRARSPTSRASTSA